MDSPTEAIKRLAALVWKDEELEVVSRRLPGENAAYPPYIAHLVLGGRVKRVAHGRSSDEAIDLLRSILEEDYQLYHRGQQLRLLADLIRQNNLTLLQVAEINNGARWQKLLGSDHQPKFDEKLVAAAYFEANGGLVLKF